MPSRLTSLVSSCSSSGSAFNSEASAKFRSVYLQSRYFAQATPRSHIFSCENWPLGRVTLVKVRAGQGLAKRHLMIKSRYTAISNRACLSPSAFSRIGRYLPLRSLICVSRACKTSLFLHRLTRFACSMKAATSGPLLWWRTLSWVY